MQIKKTYILVDLISNGLKLNSIRPSISLTFNVFKYKKMSICFVIKIKNSKTMQVTLGFMTTLTGLGK